jgi:hypothetical protein
VTRPCGVGHDCCTMDLEHAQATLAVTSHHIISTCCCSHSLARQRQVVGCHNCVEGLVGNMQLSATQRMSRSWLLLWVHVLTKVRFSPNAKGDRPATMANSRWVPLLDTR